MLTRDELEELRTVVASLAPGRYTVKQMFGKAWENNYRPRDYGKRFKASVLHDDVPGVRWLRSRSDRSHEYEVNVS